MRLCLGLLELSLLSIELLSSLSLPLEPLLFSGSHEVELFKCLPIYSLALCVVLLQGPILEGEFIHFFAHQVIVGSRHFSILITLQDIYLALQFLVLSVQEVHLTLELDDALLILLILVLHIDLLKILDRCVQVMEAQDLVVTDLDLVFEFLSELLLGGEALLHLVNDLVQLLATVVSLAHFLGPLSLLS